MSKEKINFKRWDEIRDWATEHGFKNLAKRLQLNNDCWMSSGEFGRNQKYLCDTIRFAESYEKQVELGGVLEDELSENLGLY